jgi:hypothetical protein
MSWNYRVIESVTGFTIHDVYYNDAGAITNVSVDEVAAYGETLDELRSDLEHYVAALEKPVLKLSEIKFSRRDDLP